jgi:Zn-dependent protease
LNAHIDLLGAALGFAVLLVSLTIHEAAHALTADRLGDPTARMLGRVSLNPAVHVDPIGTLLLPIIAAFTGLPLIGWAKPVPVNVRNLRQPRRDFMLVAAAGPISNLLQAVAASFVLRGLLAGGAAPAMVEAVLRDAVIINLLLAFFNLIPVPPLDGGNVLLGLLPPHLAVAYARLRQFGFIILYALMLTGIASSLIFPPAFFLARILLPWDLPSP